MGRTRLRGDSQAAIGVLIKLPYGTMVFCFKGGEEVYITLNDITQLLMLICEVVTVLLPALDWFKSNKK